MAKSMVPPDVAENMKGIKHKIVILSGKGGVGKTTVATNLATSFAKRGKSAGILDVDIYGPNVPKLLGLEGQRPAVDDEFIEPVPGPLNMKVMSMGFLLQKDDDAVAWRGPLVAKAISQFLANVRWGDLDILVVDLPPGTGDETRMWGPPFTGGESAYYISLNKNKRSLTLNIKKEKGKVILRKLIAQSDVLIENYRLGTLEKLGFSYESLKEINPRLIYCNITGYGKTGPLAHEAGVDIVVAAEAGLIGITGEKNGPSISPIT